MIYWLDSILFNGDLIIKLRLKYMYQHVHKFYICEQRYTYQGQRKDVLYIESCKEWFEPYLDKIVFLVDEQTFEGLWKHEYKHRNYAADKIYEDMKDQQYILSVCDSDEIPDVNVVNNTIQLLYNKTTEGAVHIQQDLMFYNLNWYCSKWSLAYFINNISLEKYRDLEGYRSGRLPISSMKTIQCGWHCSYFMTFDEIIRKIQSFSHSEYNKPEYTNMEIIKKCIQEGNNIFNRDGSKLNKNSTPLDQFPVEFQEFQKELVSLQKINNKPLKALVLILASDNDASYAKYETQWKRYMHSHPNFTCYFYKSCPTLDTPYKLIDDCLYIRLNESLSNIFEKTKLAFQYFEDNFSSFDYIIRPNISSFLIFDRYYRFLENLPRENVIEGVKLNAYNYDFPSGCGYTCTPDVARIIMQSKQTQYHMDDVTVGKICYDNKIPIIVRKNNIGINLDNYDEKLKESSDTGQFHFRVVSNKNDRTNDLEVYKKLVDHYYVKSE